MIENNNYTNSIFEKEWWLNAVTGGNWDAITITRKDKKIIARFPFYKTKRLGCKIIGVPPLTQTLGIYIEDTGAKLSKKLEKEKKIIKLSECTRSGGPRYIIMEFNSYINNLYRNISYPFKGFNNPK